MEPQQQDGAPPDEAAAAATIAAAGAGAGPYGMTGPVDGYGPTSASTAGGGGGGASGCTTCEAFLQGHCPSNQLLFFICKLRSGTVTEKEEAARQLGEFAKESVRACLCSVSTAMRIDRLLTCG